LRWGASEAPKPRRDAPLEHHAAHAGHDQPIAVRRVSTMVQVAPLSHPDYMIEIEALAVV
jgi:hypothetical protein